MMYKEPILEEEEEETTDGDTNSGGDSGAGGGGDSAGDNAGGGNGGDGGDGDGVDNGSGDNGAGGDIEPFELKDLDMPEGIEVSDEDWTGLKDILGDKTLTKEQANKLVAYESKRVEASQNAQVKAWEDKVDGWKTEVQNDSVLGKEENLAAAQEAAKELMSPELATLMDETGLGNNPDVIRLFHKLAPLVREHRPGGGSTGGSDRRKGVSALADEMYGKND